MSHPLASLGDLPDELLLLITSSAVSLDSRTPTATQARQDLLAVLSLLNKRLLAFARPLLWRVVRIGTPGQAALIQKAPPYLRRCVRDVVACVSHSHRRQWDPYASPREEEPALLGMLAAANTLDSLGNVKHLFLYGFDVGDWLIDTPVFHRLESLLLCDCTTAIAPARGWNARYEWKHLSILGDSTFTGSEATSFPCLDYLRISAPGDLEIGRRAQSALLHRPLQHGHLARQWLALIEPTRLGEEWFRALDAAQLTFASLRTMRLAYPFTEVPILFTFKSFTITDNERFALPSIHFLRLDEDHSWLLPQAVDFVWQLNHLKVIFICRALHPTALTDGRHLGAEDLVDVCVAKGVQVVWTDNHRFTHLLPEFEEYIKSAGMLQDRSVYVR